MGNTFLHHFTAAFTLFTNAKTRFNFFITLCILFTTHCNCVLFIATIAAPAIAPDTADAVSDCVPTSDRNIAAVVPARPPATAITATAPVLSSASHNDCKMPTPAAAPAAAPTTASANIVPDIATTATTATVNAIVTVSGIFFMLLAVCIVELPFVLLQLLLLALQQLKE